MIRLLRSIRSRLTFWYASVLGAILLAYAGGVYLMLREQLYRDLDRQLYDDFESIEDTLEHTENGGIRRVGFTALHHHEAGESLDERWIDVWNTAGTRLYREGPQGTELPKPAGNELFSRAAAVRTVATAYGLHLRIHSKRNDVGGVPVLLRVGRSERNLRHELGELLGGIAFGLPAALLLAGAGGYYLAGRALKPVGLMADQAKTITADHLAERLPIDNPDDELGRLGTIFNQTLARLERSFEALRRFTADAAHELRTPLTALRSVGEVGLQRRDGETACREVIASMLEEADRLTRLVETLLTLSRAEEGRVEVDPREVHLLRFAEEMTDVLGVLADEKGQQLTVEGADEVVAWADPLVLRQAVLNVLENAIKHSPEGSLVQLVVGRDSATATLDVIDQGPGIESEHLPRIFDRFYRVDKARSRATGGTGLGLAIAQWALRVNGGTIEVESRAGEGSTFRLRVPLASTNGSSGCLGDPSPEASEAQPMEE